MVLQANNIDKQYVKDSLERGILSSKVDAINRWTKVAI